MFFGGKEMIMFEGVVESRQDPLMVGRVKVRCHGYHDPDKQKMPTDSLPWAMILIQPDDMKNVIGYKEGDWVMGFFRDGESKQYPVVLGKLSGGIPEQKSDPTVGFYDPTLDADLVPGKVARPPEMIPPSVSLADAAGTEDVGKYSNPNQLPIEATSTGQLEKDFGKQPFPFDVNGDGVYNATDASILIDPSKEFVDGEDASTFPPTPGQAASSPISRYPLEDRLKESLASRLARNENIDKTFVPIKKANLLTGPTAAHAPLGVGTDTPAEADSFGEPATPYDAKYGFNHVLESESGHVIERDDTPLKERTHDWHRTGTFKEVHPDGQEVQKTVNDRYLLSNATMNVAAVKDVNVTALSSLRMFGQDVVNIESGTDLNQDCAQDRNILVGRNSNTRIKKNVYMVIQGDVRILVEGNINVAAEGDIKIKAKGNFLVDAANIKATAKDDFVAEAKNTLVNAHELNTLKAGAAVITEGPLTYTNTALTDGILIRATFADAALVADTVDFVPDIPHAILPDLHQAFSEENDADNKDDLVTSSPPKEGYIFNDNSVVTGTLLPGDLWKPISDSTGKLVVLTLMLGQQAKIYEALPTGDLQDALLQYKHKDGTITEWNVKRPVHKKGRFIEAGTYKGNANGGRDGWSFKKSGGKYPTPCILSIGPTEYLIVESVARHEAF